MEETFAQIEGAAEHSIPDVNVSITSGGSIIGQGVTASDKAIRMCGGKIDDILQSFGGIEGGDTSFGGKSISVVKKVSSHGEKMSAHLGKKMQHMYEQATDLEAFATLGKSALNSVVSDKETKAVLEKIISHIDGAARSIRGTVDKEIHAPKQRADDFIERNGQFLRAIKSLGAHVNESSKAGMLSLSFSSINQLKKLAKDVSNALKLVDMKKKEFLGASLSQLDSELTRKLATQSKKMSTQEMKNFLQAWSTLMNNHGHKSELREMIGGYSKTDSLSDRLLESRKELRNMINKFIDAFGLNINGIATSATSMASEFGKRIDYDEKTIVFLDTFKRLTEYLNSNRSKIYQHLLELNADQIDSKEIKDRFLSSMRDLAERASALDSTPVTKAFAQHCRDTIDTINKFSDMIKSHRDAVKKEGGSTDSANELFSIDSSKLDITGLLNPLENLEIAIKKIEFFRNIAVFRTNLQQTSKELAAYSKDYTKSVGQAIGEAITKIQNEYTEIINQVSDSKTGMGLEIDMYNESLPANQKISKEKLKTMYKWQCDSRIGLYKTVEAIDLYLLHFTESVAKNPDAVADLHKMLSATRIIAKWYDNTAGDNLIRAFESFGDVTDDQLDANDFASVGYGAPGAAGVPIFADLENKIGGEKAIRIYERCRRAVQGVVVLKNIISYFITISEKYGNFKSERNIYMAPSNIYKNLTNYIWVSALDVNTVGTEVLNDNNETKRLLTYKDTEVRMAGITNIDPETLGINFNKHSIDKLRILKCHNELSRLKDYVGGMEEEDIQRIRQFVISTFARLGKTKYIFEMFLFGVYDFSQMDSAMIKQFLQYVQSLPVVSRGVPLTTIRVVYIEPPVPPAAPPPPVVLNLVTPDDITNAVARINGIPSKQRNEQVSFQIVRNGVAGLAPLKTTAVSLDRFKTLGYRDLINIVGIDQADVPRTNAQRSVGFLDGFLRGITGVRTKFNNVSVAHRSVAALQYVLVQMLNKYKKEHSSSLFAIDDTYFILTIKAIAGKIMAVTGINSMYKNPKSYQNTILQNQTRLIMGGASGDSEVIEDAIELYVRLPLLVEFYRQIFDDGNQAFKQEIVGDKPDEETIAFVPEIGSVWSGLIINIFDKSKHIQNGVYTPENMQKIVSEINSIYKHYKGSVNNDELTRHIMMELVAEINRRYGIIKREELTQYYRVVNTTTRNRFEVGESNYTNNDLDILNEAMEFEEKSPSDEFIKFKATIADPSTPMETKMNKLTDYKILKDFRERIQKKLTRGADEIAQGHDKLSMVDRIRLLKKAIQSKQSREDKYDMIIKAIDDAESMNQSSNDIFACFHEFVIMPLRTAYQMYYALERFLTLMYALIATDLPNDDSILNIVLPDDRTFKRAILDIASDPDGIITDDAGMLYVGFARHYARFGSLDDGELILLKGDDVVAHEDLAHNKNTGLLQSLLIRTLVQFSTNSGDLIKLKISTTDSITIDFSEYQKVCEYLIANVKFMVDKFTGLVPSSLLNKVTNPSRPDGEDNMGSVYTLEHKLLNGMFNKLNKKEKERDVLSTDNLNSLMPIVSRILFKGRTQFHKLFQSLVLQPKANSYIDEYKWPDFSVNVTDTMPVILDCFKTYSNTARAFTLVAPDKDQIQISSLLFNPKSGACLSSLRQPNFGIIQEFNTLISCYLNDLYDSQSHKIYTKAFANFAGSALINALNGQSIPDFVRITVSDPGFTDLNNAFKRLYDMPRSQVVLSSTLAYVMRTLMNRTNPITGMKIHETAQLQDLSAHVMEKYRSIIPMYLRIFKSFVARCQLYRKMIGRIQANEPSTWDTLDVTPVSRIPIVGNMLITSVKEMHDDTSVQFSNTTNDSISSLANGADVKDTINLYLDEIVNGMGSLIQDVESIQKELQETDPTVSLYFDLKKDFTKNYYTQSKQLPFAPLSILAMGYANTNPEQSIVPIYKTSDNASNKFLYGLRSLLMNDFTISSKTVPYLKKLVDDFNGYTISSNSISEKKFNDVLHYVGKAANFIYDFRFFNGSSYSQSDLLSSFSLPRNDISTFQEKSNKVNSLNLIENVNIDESKNKIAGYVKDGHVRPNVDRVEWTNTRKAVLAAVDSIIAHIRPAYIQARINRYNRVAHARSISVYFRRKYENAAARLTRLHDDLQRTQADKHAAALRASALPNVDNDALGLASDEAHRVVPFGSEDAVVINLALDAAFARLTKHPNARNKAIMVNLIDTNIMPINVHSLMREIPLANLYNYAMSFDAIVDSLKIPNTFKELLKRPYVQMALTRNPADRTVAADPANPLIQIGDDVAGALPIQDILNDSNLRFIKDQLFAKLLRFDGTLARQPTPQQRRLRFDSKLFRNLLFLTLVQQAIKKKVRSELDFINTRVVDNTSAINNVITDLRVDGVVGDDGNLKDVSEDLFDF